jgi:hypothetical protein
MPPKRDATSKKQGAAGCYCQRTRTQQHRKNTTPEGGGQAGRWINDKPQTAAPRGSPGASARWIRQWGWLHTCRRTGRQWGKAVARSCFVLGVYLLLALRTRTANMHRTRIPAAQATHGAPHTHTSCTRTCTRVANTHRTYTRTARAQAEYTR